MDEDRLADIFIVGAYLTIIILRLCNVVNWSWFWILCPFWIPLVGAAIGVIIGSFIGVIILIDKKIRGIKNERY